MKETRTINLNGLVYHIDNDAYQQLRDYLSDIELRLPSDERQEVMSDIEARIAELIQKALFAKNTQVVTIEMVGSIRAQIGEPSEFGENRRPKVKVDKSQNSGCGRILRILLNVVLVILALPVICIGLVILTVLLLSMFGVAVAGSSVLGAALPMATLFGGLLMEGSAWLVPLLMLALVVVVGLPIVMIVYAIVTKMRTRRGPKARFWIVTLLFWLSAVVFWGSSLVRIVQAIGDAPEVLQNMVADEMDWDETGMVSSTLQLDAFHSVQLDGAAELRLSNAEQVSAVLTTNMAQLMQENINLKTEVRDSVLYIDVPTNVPGPLKVELAIAAPCLRKVSVRGASKIETPEGHSLTQAGLTLDLNGAAEAELALDVNELTIDSKGASRLELEGRANDARITIAGAGKVDAEELIVRDLHINCAGASQAEVNVTGELWAQAAGASKITYIGKPVVKQKMAVGGSFIVAD